MTFNEIELIVAGVAALAKLGTSVLKDLHVISDAKAAKVTKAIGNVDGLAVHAFNEVHNVTDKMPSDADVEAYFSAAHGAADSFGVPWNSDTEAMLKKKLLGLFKVIRTNKHATGHAAIPTGHAPPPPPQGRDAHGKGLPLPPPLPPASGR